jgi:hypothetical protein
MSAPHRSYFLSPQERGGDVEHYRVTFPVLDELVLAQMPEKMFPRQTPGI